MQKRAKKSLFLMICTQTSCVMICHHSVMDKKSRIKMIRLFWCGKCLALRKRLIIVFSEKTEAVAEVCPVPTQQKRADHLVCSSLLVRETGLEPVHQRYTPLKRARLPIPPLPRTFDIIAHSSLFVNSFLKKSPRIFIFPVI